MNDTVQKLRVAVHAESVLMKLRTRKAMRSAVLLAVGLVFSLFAIGVLNGATFEALRAWMPVFRAGLIVGGIDLLIAALLVRAALKEEPDGPEESLAREVRDLTVAALEKDFEAARSEAHEFVQDVRRIRSAVGFVTQGISGPLRAILEFVGEARGDSIPPKEDAASKD